MSLATLRALGLSEADSRALKVLLGNRCFDSAGLAIGTTKSKVKTANAISYSIDGRLYSKAGTDDLFVHTDLTVQPDLTTRYYALCLDASGNASVVAGTADGYMPQVADTLCVIGALKVVTNGATYTPATTLNDAAGVTATYVNLSVVPTSGQP